ncbi:HAD-IIA family hydrolase [Gallaecimonas pentaromativorans]|uniref:HAD-IIA family hydrolase n=1 Tax=Gallaecimonas pentaromativorans TaxID=584787 RepID=UPI003A8EE337
MVKGILCDLDGVVYQHQGALPGAVEAIHALQQANVPLAFVTNTTSASSDMLAKKLGQLGVNIPASHIITPVTVARAELEGRGLERIWLLTNPALKSAFDGFVLDKTRPQALVVADLGKDWRYELLNAAFNYLIEHPKVPVISLGLSDFYQGKDQLMLDVGPFARLLAQSSGNPLVVCGKPGRETFHLGARLLNLAPNEVAMVGDDINTDALAAMDAGLTGILVKTGKFRSSQLNGRQSDVILEGLWALPAWLRDQ